MKIMLMTRFGSVMQHFANELVVHEIPPAAQSWSQIQFRLRYRSQRRDRSYIVHIDADSSSYLDAPPSCAVGGRSARFGNWVSALYNAY